MTMPRFLFSVVFVCLSTGFNTRSLAQGILEKASQTYMPQKDVQSVAPITFPELKRFARDWRRYNKWLKQNGNQYKAVSYLDITEQNDFTQPVLEWLNKNDWSGDRFFLIEQRLRETLSALKKEDKKNLYNDAMQRQIRTVQNDSTKKDDEKKILVKQYEDNIVEQSKLLSFTFPVTTEELNLIRVNRKSLESVMDL